eukprot:1161781-Pelagomonas_calceolata.AAC.5
MQPLCLGGVSFCQPIQAERSAYQLGNKWPSCTLARYCTVSLSPCTSINARSINAIPGAQSMLLACKATDHGA